MLIAGASSSPQEAERRGPACSGRGRAGRPRRAAPALAAPPPPCLPARPARGGTGGRARRPGRRGRGGWRSPRRSRAPSSPLRQRQSRSERQWSSRETMIATRLRSLDSAKRWSISKRPATSSSKRPVQRLALGLGHRVEDHPHEAASPRRVECWSASTMLSPASARKPLTAAIRPGRSGQASSRRDVECSAIGAIMPDAGLPVPAGFPARSASRVLCTPRSCLTSWRLTLASSAV